LFAGKVIMAEGSQPSWRDRFSIVEVVIRIAVVLIGVGGIYLAACVFSSRALWICNPFPKPIQVLVDGRSIEVPANSVSKEDLGNKELSVEAPALPGFEKLQVDLGTWIERPVTVLDLAADAAYVQVDVSRLYSAQPMSDQELATTGFTIAKISAPGRIHVFEPGTAKEHGLIAPGENLPDRVMVRKDKDTITKLFRISAELAAGGDQELREAIAAVVLEGEDTRTLEAMDRGE
jgi:hypothetical protein